MSHKLICLLTFCLFTKVFAAGESASENWSAPFPEDTFTRFLEGLTYTVNIQQMQDQGLAKGYSAEPLWSGSYWPIHRGVLGVRYADRSVPQTKSFSANYANFLSRSPESYIYSGNTNLLSPAEKYDLLVGDGSWALTRYMWGKGLEDLREQGVVATWTGICHGFSAAASMGVKSPVNAVTVTDVSGQHSILFYPEDIKALQSYLWAASSPESFEAGTRCRQSVVARDPFLRPVDPTCLDVNPMNFHIINVNRLGIHHQSYAMDTSRGPEVWNYPILGYDLNYYNPRTLETTHSLKMAIEPIEKLLNDKFKSYRNPSARYIVGIIMDLYHPSLTTATPYDNGQVAMHTENYIYDLELDENLNIIGGEWYMKDRPDFLWTFIKDGKAQNHEDIAVGDVEFTGNQIPQVIAEQARNASARGKVMAKIANALLQKSIGERVQDPNEHPSEPDPVGDDVPPESSPTPSPIPQPTPTPEPTPGPTPDSVG